MGDNGSISPEELGNLGESEIKLNINGVCHVEHVNDKLLDDIKIGVTIAMSPSSETVMSPEGTGSSSPAVTKRHGLKKWRRIPRELVKNPGSNIDGRKNGDLTATVNVNGNSTVSNGLHGDSGFGGQPVLASRADSINSEDQSSRSSSAASTPRTRPKISSSNGGNSDISVHSGDQKSNGRTGTTKKARGFKTEKENSDSNMGNFVFVQGTNSVASKGRQSGSSVKYDEGYSDDHKSEDVSQEDAAAEDSCDVNEEKIGKDERSFDHDALVESITGFDSAVEELKREMQKWKDIGKDEPFNFDDSIQETIELKDAMNSELESTITSEDIKTELDDLLKEKIQAEVEIVAITTTTKSLITGPLHEMKLNLQEKNMQTEKLETKKDVKELEKKVLKKQETEADVKKLQNRVCRISSCLFIQLILLFLTFYHEISSQKVELVPT